eukprot:669918-Amorphochlora_amoeboformis.AAC.2
MKYPDIGLEYRKIVWVVNTTRAMGLVSPLVGLLTAAGQWLAVYSTYTWGVEPHVLDPGVPHTLPPLYTIDNNNQPEI